jgi:phenylpyruvate tautomerase PptA (4-oxalocrotonate tautomerase family)
MPLVRIALQRGKPREYRQALADGIYEAMREAIGIPENDRFILMSEHAADELSYDRHYLGIERSDDFVSVQITLRRGRSVEAKQALYRSITERLSRAPGVRPADVLITLVENGPEDWSFGDGVAQYVK